MTKTNSPEDFIYAYEAALGTQDWKMVDPLMADNACVTFSNGAVHFGKEQVQKAFEYNFQVIKSEKYEIQNVTWIQKGAEFAVYVFEYYWSGIIDRKMVSGSGIGTTVLTRKEGSWVLLTEHLGKKVS